jgi:predicted metal-binding protein
MKDHVRARWSGAVLVCSKCSKKLDGGFGDKGRTPLAKALRQEPGFGKGRKARVGVVETKCLGICPRKGVVLVDTRAPDRWRIVPENMDVALLGDALRDAAD